MRGSDRFLRKVYGGSLAIFLMALLLSLQWVSLPVSLGLAAGYGLSIGLLVFWQVVSRFLTSPEDARPGLAVALIVLKLPLLGGAAWLLIGKGLVSPAAFVIGVTIPHLAVALIALGSWAGRSGKRPADRAGMKEEEPRVAPRA